MRRVVCDWSTWPVSESVTPETRSDARVGATRIVDLRRSAGSVEVVVARVSFAAGAGVWFGSPEFDVDGAPHPIPIVVVP